ncbi:MAG: ribonuclease III [Acidimicrobiia bacterium]
MRRPEADLGALVERLGHEFADIALLRQAMAHRSWCAEQPGDVKSNERLEFLGDAVLGWVVADLAYHCHSELAEGKLTDLRKSIVNASALAAVAEEFDIGAYLLLGKGEDAAGGRTKPSILSDAMEAVIGAVYIDGGTEAAFALIERLVGDRLTGSASMVDHLDYKTALQELTARLFDGAPVYVLREEGPDHAKHFFATVAVNGRPLGNGEGRSKKQAEQVAARMACERLHATAIDINPVAAGG